MATQHTKSSPIWLAATLLAAGVAFVARAEPSARLLCEALDNGALAAAKVRVWQGDREIASGPCGKELSISAGSYEQAISLDGVLGGDERRAPITVRSGETHRLRAEFETGELVVEVSREGRRASALIVLYRNDREVAKTSAGASSRLTVGRYLVEVESRGERRRSEALVTRAERRVVQVAFNAPNVHPK